MRSLILLSLVVSLAACGVQRPLMRPKDIPAYEEQQRKKREQIEQEKRELEAIDAKRGAVVTPITEPVN
jgi:predicted small lipoprotein YifL